MSGQYRISEELVKAIKKEIEENITCYNGDLYEDNDVSIIVGSSEWKEYEDTNFKPYIQFN